MPTPEDHGLTHASVAFISKVAGRHGRHVKVAQRAVPPVSDEIAMQWIHEADEKGLDTGRPRDKRGKERERVARK